MAHAANWYVDALAPTSGLGTSRQAAWQRFADINWSALGAGDTLHIIGDHCDRAYTEELVVGVSGREGAALVITGVSRTGAGGPVIDGENRRYFGVSLRGLNHVTLRGLTIRNHAEAGVTVRGAHAGVLVEGNRLFSGDPGGGNARGIDARGNVGTRPLVVRGNRYGTPPATKAQTDGIWSSDNDGVVFESNVIIISNSDTMGHSDGVQSFRDHSITIRGNWIEQANTAAYHNHGAWFENTRDGGIIEFHDNVVLAPNLTGDAVVAHYMRAGWNERGTVRIWNNTIWGGHRALYLNNSPSARVHANIIAASNGGHAAVVLNALPPPGAIDGNLMWSPAGTIAFMGDGNLAWRDWQALGYDANGANIHPQFGPRGIPRLRTVGTAPVGARGASLSPPPTEPAFAACLVPR
jgi:hypothetical protein